MRPPCATDALHFAKDAKMAAAVKLLEVGKLTSGQAAQFAGVGRQEFLLGCHRWGVDSVNWDAGEIEAEFASLLPGLFKNGKGARSFWTLGAADILSAVQSDISLSADRMSAGLSR